MERNKELSQTSVQWWEEKLAEDYRNYRWRQLMEPMCDKMEKWRAGELTYAEMDQALEECHQRACEVRSILTQRTDRLVTLIQWLDRDWFEAWVKEHSPPKGERLTQPLK